MLQLQRTGGVFSRVTVLIRSIGGGETWQDSVINGLPTSSPIRAALNARTKVASAASPNQDYLPLNKEVVFEVRIDFNYILSGNCTFGSNDVSDSNLVEISLFKVFFSIVAIKSRHWQYILWITRVNNFQKIYFWEIPLIWTAKDSLCCFYKFFEETLDTKHHFYKRWKLWLINISLFPKSRCLSQKFDILGHEIVFNYWTICLISRS